MHGMYFFMLLFKKWRRRSSCILPTFNQRKPCQGPVVVLSYRYIIIVISSYRHIVIIYYFERIIIHFVTISMAELTENQQYTLLIIDPQVEFVSSLPNTQLIAIYIYNTSLLILNISSRWIFIPADLLPFLRFT